MMSLFKSLKPCQDNEKVNGAHYIRPPMLKGPMELIDFNVITDEIMLYTACDYARNYHRLVLEPI